MNRLYSDDFNMVYTDPNGQFIRIEELNKMIECGVITVDKEKLDMYKFETRVQYNTDLHNKQEMFEIWKKYHCIDKFP